MIEGPSSVFSAESGPGAAGYPAPPWPELAMIGNGQPIENQLLPVPDRGVRS
jgi:hypothetical protein